MQNNQNGVSAKLQEIQLKYNQLESQCGDLRKEKDAVDKQLTETTVKVGVLQGFELELRNLKLVNDQNLTLIEQLKTQKANCEKESSEKLNNVKG